MAALHGAGGSSIVYRLLLLSQDGTIFDTYEPQLAAIRTTASLPVVTPLMATSISQLQAAAQVPIRARRPPSARQTASPSSSFDVRVRRKDVRCNKDARWGSGCRRNESSA